MVDMEVSIDTSELQLPGEYDLESNFNEREAREWMRENWHKSVFFAVAYVVLVFGIQHFMKEKKAYNLRAPLVLWSFNLALFNAIVACRVWKQMAFILSTKGFKQSVCSQSFFVHPISKLWVYLFVWSKFLEMGQHLDSAILQWDNCSEGEAGDTMFIVLRKKKLIFLQWFHHSSTVMITWYGYVDMLAGSGWLVILNSSIHATMYSYYAVRVAGFQVPRFLAMVITISQIVQLLGFVIMYTLIIFWMEDKVCHATWTSGFLSFMFSLSILVLFCNYFLKTYLGSSQKPKGQ